MNLNYVVGSNSHLAQKLKAISPSNKKHVAELGFFVTCIVDFDCNYYHKHDLSALYRPASNINILTESLEMKNYCTAEPLFFDL